MSALKHQTTMDEFEKKIDELKKKMKELGAVYVEIVEVNTGSPHGSPYGSVEKPSLTKIHDLWINSKFTEPDKGMEFFYFGSYYRFVEQNLFQTKKYYLMGVERGDQYSMNSLGATYRYAESDIGRAKMYFLMGVEIGSDLCMNSLGHLYYREENNHEQAEKYYLMAIEKGKSAAMNNLGILYSEGIKDFTLAKKFYIMAIQHGNGKASFNYINMYHTQRNKPTKALYIASMSVENGKFHALVSKILTTIVGRNIKPDKYFFNSLPNLKKIENQLPELIKVVIKLYTKEIDVLENSFTYAPEEDGYHKALTDYQFRLTQ